MRTTHNQPTSTSVHNPTLFGKLFKLLCRNYKSHHRTFEELCAAIDAQKDQIPSLTNGGFTRQIEAKK